MKSTSCVPDYTQANGLFWLKVHSFDWKVIIFSCEISHRSTLRWDVCTWNSGAFYNRAKMSFAFWSYSTYLSTVDIYLYILLYLQNYTPKTPLPPHPTPYNPSRTPTHMHTCLLMGTLPHLALNCNFISVSVFRRAGFQNWWQRCAWDLRVKTPGGMFPGRLPA